MADHAADALARIERLARTMVGQENSKGALLAFAREIQETARNAMAAKPAPSGQRVSIVFESGASIEDGVSFSMHVEGANRELMACTPREEWPTATFWAWRGFEILSEIVKRAAGGQELR